MVAKLAEKRVGHLVDLMDVMMVALTDERMVVEMAVEMAESKAYSLVDSKAALTVLK